MKLYNDTEDTFTLCPSNFLRTIRAIAASSQTRNVEEAIGEKQRFDLFCSLDRTDKKKLIQIFLLPLLVPPLNTSNSPENLQFRQKNTGRTDCSPIPTFLEPLRVEIVLPTEGSLSLSLSYKIIRPNTCPCWRRNGASTEPNFFSRNLKGEGGAIKPADAFERNVTGLRPFSSFLGPRNGPPIPRRSLTTGRFSTNRAG